MKNILIEFAAWSVCETDDDYRSPNELDVYAEHFRDCRFDPGEGYNPTIPYYSWEFDDGVGDDEVEACWKCGTPVPTDVIALVQLHNWGRMGRYDG